MYQSNGSQQRGSKEAHIFLLVGMLEKRRKNQATPPLRERGRKTRQPVHWMRLGPTPVGPFVRSDLTPSCFLKYFEVWNNTFMVRRRKSLFSNSC